jgi:hypothetical protein
MSTAAAFHAIEIEAINSIKDFDAFILAVLRGICNLYNENKTSNMYESMEYLLRFAAYEENAETDADKAIAAFMSIIGQAAVAFGGWSLWDSIRNECGAWELEEQEMPDFYAQLVGNLKVEDK